MGQLVLVLLQSIHNHTTSMLQCLLDKKPTRALGQTIEFIHTMLQVPYGTPCHTPLSTEIHELDAENSIAQTSRIELLCHPSIQSVGTQQTLVVSGVESAQAVYFLAVPDSTSSKVIKYVEFNQLFPEARFHTCFNTPLLSHLPFSLDPSFSGDNNYERSTNANTTGLSSCCYAFQGITQNLHLFAYQYIIHKASSMSVPNASTYQQLQNNFISWDQNVNP